MGQGNEQVRASRQYHSPRRAEQAAATRQAVLAAAWELFVSTGYAATTVVDIAARARVSVDTVYAVAGRKPTLLRELLQTALSGADKAGPAAPDEQRDHVRPVRGAGTAREKIAVYAHAIAELQQRRAPVFLALRDAAATDPECAALWEEISRRRAKNMRFFAADLRSTGELRGDLSDEEVADIVWSMNAAEYWALLVHERGWSPSRFTAWIIDAWTRLLLRPPPRR
ncbi:MAG: TetR/AcrR family transcriptional regulator [Pseudonocardiaceae bacterium]